jgi:hypothetical protein
MLYVYTHDVIMYIYYTICFTKIKWLMRKKVLASTLKVVQIVKPVANNTYTPNTQW